MDNNVSKYDGHGRNGNGKSEDFWSARFLALEARVVAMDMLLSAMIVTNEERAAALDRLELDVTDWANRATRAAQSPLAKEARVQATRMLRDLRETAALERPQ